jgi:hypothetical protein
VQRAEDGGIHPGQAPESGFGEAMAQSIEACARDIERRELHSFESLWSRAGSVIGSFILGRHGLPEGARLPRARSSLESLVRMLNELGPPPEQASLHIHSGWQQHGFIAAELLRRISIIKHRGAFDASTSTWTDGAYQLVCVNAPDENPVPARFELRIHSPGLDVGEPASFVAWRFRADHADAPLKPRKRLFENSGFADERFRCAVIAHVDARLEAMLQGTAGDTLNAAFEAYWWMLRQQQVAVGDKAQHVLHSVLLACGHALPPSPPGRDPALCALAMSRDDWLEAAPALWGLIGPRSLLGRELTGRLPRPTLPAANAAPDLAPLIDALSLSASPEPGRRRRAQQAADAEDFAQFLKAFQAKRRIA